MSTILHHLAAWADSAPNAAAQSAKKDGKWSTLTAREFCDRVFWLALYLESRGMGPEDVGALFSYNCPEWVHMELACQLLGAKSAGIYPNSSHKDIQYVLTHTQSRFLAVQNQEYFKKMIGEGEVALPNQIELFLVFDGDTSFSPKAVAYETAVAEGKKLAHTKSKPPKLVNYLKKLDPQAGSFLIYTSGTTGNPKGALLSHDNFVFTAEAVGKHWKLPSQGVLFSFLPLCHVAEKLQNLGASIFFRYHTYYCSKFENVAVELPEVQPTLLLCVPRVWEKMMEGVLNKLKQASPLKAKLGQWAFEVGKRHAEAKYGQRKEGGLDHLQWRLADRLVLSKVRKALGLSQAEALASGAAALSISVAQWFRCIGLEINEDYGQTESTGVVCMTERDRDCLGTVGVAVPGVKVKIAEDGEILTRGRHVFCGYFKDEASTTQVLEGGWLHTGDIGEIDSRGYIRIRGRKKEVLKTSGGKMIAPLPIEEALKNFPMISQVCMVGDGQKYLAALITLSESKLQELNHGNGALEGVIITTPKVVAEVKGYVDQVNATLASYAQIKKFAILSKEFSILEGEMTPTLKMKRNVIESRYQDVIQKLYGYA